MNFSTKANKNKDLYRLKSKVGDTIRFVRRNVTMEGVVRLVKENVVIVEIGLCESVFLGLENELTVVAHKNYEVVNYVELRNQA